MQPHPLLDANCQHCTILSFFAGKLKDVPQSGQREILKQHYEDIHQYMDSDVIRPHLYQYKLLTPEEMTELTGTNKTSQIKKILEWIPEKGPDALGKLIICLQESAFGTGTAHENLARKLEHSLQEWNPPKRINYGNNNKQGNCACTISVYDTITACRVNYSAANIRPENTVL